jgi:hypothetical protein
MNEPSVILLVKNPGGDFWEPQGLHTFAVFPRIGDHIERDYDNGRHWYRVVAYVQTDVPASNAGNIYAVHVGKSMEVQRAFFGEG